MKKSNQSIVFVLIIMLVTVNASAQGFSQLDEAPHDISYYRESMVTPPLVKVLYGRPAKKDVKVFGNTVAYNEIWRTGANEATEVKFYQDIVFGGVKVPAGTYVLYTIPGEREWEVILSSNLDVLGAFQYDPVFDVARVRVNPSRAEELKVFSISFREHKEALQMVLGWDTTRVKIPLEVKKKGTVATKFNTDRSELQEDKKS